MIKDIYAKKRPLFSFEVFPPKKDGEFEAVYSVLDRLAALNPDFISVTYGAGGSNSKKYREIAAYIQGNCHIEALAHLTSVGLNKEQLRETVDSLKASGVHNILALRGDRPKTMTDEQFHNRSFTYAAEMTAFLKEDPALCVAGACYPEKHFEAPDMQTDLTHLKEKADAGADFLITQLFFDNDSFYRLRENAGKLGIHVPISAGIMPVTSVNQLGTTVSLSGSSVPKQLSDVLAKYADSPADMKKAGIDFAISQIEGLLSNGVDGIHIYTMNKPEISEIILKAVK